MKKINRIMCAFAASLMLISYNCALPVQADTPDTGSADRFITVDNKEMRVVLYGDLEENGTEFADPNKETLVMLPALGVPSPNIYFKPLAEELDNTYNVVIVEPLGYGLSDTTEETRTVENINSELNEALEELEIASCTLLVHSISGVYGLNFVYSYPEKVNGFIAVDNTVYDEELSGALEMEQEYMLQATQAFDSLRNSFECVEDFESAIAADPSKYGAELPDITGYTYSQSDQEEYYKAYARSSNQTIQNEIQNMGQGLESIKGEKFPSELPVLTMVSSDNAAAMPAWKTAHQAQLDLETGNHELYVVDGSHYIWYTNLAGVVEHILEWNN